MLTLHCEGISNAKRGAFLESKMPIPFLKLEPTKPLMDNIPHTPMISQLLPYTNFNFPSCGVQLTPKDK